MTSDDIAFSVSDFVAVFNQTINYAYPSVTVVGELANFRVSKNRWVYFDLKDDIASVKFFGTIYQLQGPLEEGMMLTVRGVPQLHPLYGFSITVQSIQLTGEGTLKRAAQLLETKLRTEGLFDESRKRAIPYPVTSIGLITSSESAAYADFIKILKERWGGVDIRLYDVQVQGDSAPGQIIEALDYFNSHADAPEVIVVTRGGGSADDLQAFSTEQVSRAIAASRIPTMVAIGHEIDSSLAELAADKRASTPSNAAQALVPERAEVAHLLKAYREQASHAIQSLFAEEKQAIREELRMAGLQLSHELKTMKQGLHNMRQLLELLHPKTTLNRGYAIVRTNQKIVRSVQQVSLGNELQIQLGDGTIVSVVKNKSKVQ